MAKQSSGGTSFESKSSLKTGAERFLSQAVAHALEDNWRTADDFLRQFKPLDLMLGLQSAPDLRGLILTRAVGFHERIARKKSTESAAEDLRIALEEGVTTAADILSSISPDDRVRYLDSQKLFAFAVDDEIFSPESSGIERDRAIDCMIFLLETAVGEGLAEYSDLTDGVTFEAIAQYLPVVELQRIVEAALKLGREGDALTDERLIDVVSLRTLVSHIPLDLFWTRVVIDKVAAPAGFTGAVMIDNGLAAAVPSSAPKEAARTPEPVRALEPARAPEATRAPEVAPPPEPVRSPEPARVAEAVKPSEPARAPEGARVSEPARAQEAQRAPAQERARTPEPAKAVPAREPPPKVQAKESLKEPPPKPGRASVNGKPKAEEARPPTGSPPSSDHEVDGLLEATEGVGAVSEDDAPRRRVIDRLTSIQRLPPRHADLPTGILFEIDSMYAELNTTTNEEIRAEIVRDSFPNEQHMSTALLALIELLEPSIDLKDPELEKSADVDALLNVFLIEEREHQERAAGSQRPAPPPGGLGAAPPPPPPPPAQAAKRTIPPPLPRTSSASPMPPPLPGIEKSR